MLKPKSLVTVVFCSRKLNEVMREPLVAETMILPPVVT